MSDVASRKARLSTTAMLEDLERVVMAESPSDDLDALEACAVVVEDLVSRRLGWDPKPIDIGVGAPALEWGPPDSPILLLGHYDTVWEGGTTSRWPFEVTGARATGPGVFDMKAGIVQAVHGLAVLEKDDVAGVRLLLTPDEETGSAGSRSMIEGSLGCVRACFVLEPAVDAALKVARKGVSEFEVEIRGRASHAGLDPELGFNTTNELANVILAVRELGGRYNATITPTVARSGSTTNTVPGVATLAVDVRSWSADELNDIETALRSIRASSDGFQISIRGGVDRLPMDHGSSGELFAVAKHLWREIGEYELSGRAVGGASDANIAAGLGVPTLDGLGAVGGNAHAEGEFIEVQEMTRRAALLAGLIEHEATRN